MRNVTIYEVFQWLGHKSVNTTMIHAYLAPRRTRSTCCEVLGPGPNACPSPAAHGLVVAIASLSAAIGEECSAGGLARWAGSLTCVRGHDLRTCRVS